jgi:hypothetical protein
MAAYSRKRPLRIGKSSELNDRFTPDTGHSSIIVVNGCYRPKTDLPVVAIDACDYRDQVGTQNHALGILQS